MVQVSNALTESCTSSASRVVPVSEIMSMKLSGGDAVVQDALVDIISSIR